MSIDAIQAEQIPNEEASESLMAARIDFAERTFLNAQELGRFMDLKANFLLSAVALMTAALGIVASKALDATSDETWHLVLKSLGLISFVAYILIAFGVIYTATRVFKALPSLLPDPTTAPGMIFPLTILQRYLTDTGPHDQKYLERLSRINLQDMLHDYANQIIQVSSIYERKQKQINLAIRLFQYMSISWIITVLLLLAVTVLK
jgi:hypothetical protein